MTDRSVRFVAVISEPYFPFFQWLEDEELPIPARSSQLDDSLAKYLEHLWLDDVNVTYAGHTLSAFRRFYPAMRFKLTMAKQFFTNWKSIHVPGQAVPMPANVAMALAGVAITIKEEALALLILLGFTAFLRTSEIIQLAPRQIHVNVAEGVVILALPATKTSKTKKKVWLCVTPSSAVSPSMCCPPPEGRLSLSPAAALYLFTSAAPQLYWLQPPPGRSIPFFSDGQTL